MERITTAYTEAWTSATGAHGTVTPRTHRTGLAGRSRVRLFLGGGGRAATNFAARMEPATRARLSALAHTVLALPVDWRRMGTQYPRR
jgi:hypothetical protein